MSARGYRMRVTTVDRNGRRKGRVEWVNVPPADRFASEGISQIQPFVSRVLRSTADSAWIVIATPSGRTAISIGKHNGALSLGVSVGVRERKCETSVRSFFAERGIGPSRDYLAGNGGVPNAVRILEFPLPRTAQRSAVIAADLLRAVYRLTNRSALDIRLTENEQPNFSSSGRAASSAGRRRSTSR